MLMASCMSNGSWLGIEMERAHAILKKALGDGPAAFGDVTSWEPAPVFDPRRTPMTGGDAEVDRLRSRVAELETICAQLQETVRNYQEALDALTP